MTRSKKRMLQKNRDFDKIVRVDIERRIRLDRIILMQRSARILSRRATIADRPSNGGIEQLNESDGNIETQATPSTSSGINSNNPLRSILKKKFKNQPFNIRGRKIINRRHTVFPNAIINQDLADEQETIANQDKNVSTGNVFEPNNDGNVQYISDQEHIQQDEARQNILQPNNVENIQCDGDNGNNIQKVSDHQQQHELSPSILQANNKENTAQ